MKKLSSRQWVPYPFEAVRDIFKKPATLGKLTPPQYKASIEGDETTAENAQIVIRVQPTFLPVKISWLSKIQNVSEDAEKFYFEDIQLSGPFAYWKHHHTIEKASSTITGRSGKETKVDEPGTWIIDDVEYKMPFGFLGSIAGKLFAESQLQEMFSYRKKATLKYLEELTQNKSE